MGTYLLNFIIYSMAMVGLLFICLMVYKKTMVNGKCTKNNEELAVENALTLSPRKTIYVVKVGNEKFLVAGDAERTTFLAKLNSQEPIIAEKITTIPVEITEKPIFLKFKTKPPELKLNIVPEMRINKIKKNSEILNRKEKRFLSAIILVV